ncbi:MAG: hypothetical protein IJV02_00140 [Candidatus Methanomethylophilaceae archaeon]|nr:hypothetical protein [Candidatus Methanomethylophilaceae archaeon]MBR1452536.1 hypothetical protein [Candidatus Methanomethylophilaceae archaeon]
MIVNDPCAFCVHLYDDSDPSVGLYGTGCDIDTAVDGWVQGQGTPCPGFQP